MRLVFTNQSRVSLRGLGNICICFYVISLINVVGLEFEVLAGLINFNRLPERVIV